jgi:hypothetical protein
MKTENDQSEELGYWQRVALAVIPLKQRLHHDYEQAYPDLRELIPAILDQAEKNAWELSVFPHLLLPSLVEAHFVKLALRPNHARDRSQRALNGVIAQRHEGRRPYNALQLRWPPPDYGLSNAR